MLKVTFAFSPRWMCVTDGVGILHVLLKPQHFNALELRFEDSI